MKKYIKSTAISIMLVCSMALFAFAACEENFFDYGACTDPTCENFGWSYAGCHPGEPDTACGGAGTYVIAAGDTLAKIAEKFDVTIEDIMDQNPGVVSRDLIYAGETLCIPASSGSGKPSQDELSQTDPASREYELLVIELVNERRAEAGLEPLVENAALTALARLKAQDMSDNNYFSHQSPVYGSPFDMMRSSGIDYYAAGENIAMGYDTAQEVVAAWMNSDGHRKNILSETFAEIGVGFEPDGQYCSQMFIRL